MSTMMIDRFDYFIVF